MFIILFVVLVASQYTQLTETQPTTCASSPLINYLELNYSTPKQTFTFTISEPHYAVDIYVDFYLIGPYLDQSILIQVDTLQEQELIIQYDNSVPFCSGTTTPPTPNQLYTYSNTFVHFQNQLSLTISVSGFTLGVRNIQIFPKVCHSTCTQCVGPSQNQCRSCASGAQLSRKTNQCRCPSTTPYLEQNQCVNKCSNDRYYDEIQCQIDQQIINLYEYFWNDYIYTGWNMIDNGIITPLVDKQYIGMNGKIMGLFLPTQSINYKYNNLLDLIRIRMDIYIFSSAKQPQIILQVDKLQNIITPLHNYTISGSNGYIIYHVDETIDANQNANITISLNTDSTTRWGINQVVINSVNCQANCQECSSRMTCNLCMNGYFKYKGTCVTSCPKFSTQFGTTTCQDISEIYTLTDTLLRAFDDNIISKFVVNVNTSILSYKQNKFGTFYNGYRYFGGLKDKFNQYFFKTYTQLPPHYRIIIQFQIQTFEFNGGESANTVRLSTDKSNLLFIPSDSTKEQSVNEIFDHQGDELKLSLLSVPDSGTYFSFGIRDLNIMIQRCYPLCKRCTGSQQTDCLEWIYEPNSNQQYTCNNGFIFSMEQQKCVLCPLGCQKCQDEKTCLKCETNFIKQGSGCHCQNGYIDEFTLDCINNS